MKKNHDIDTYSKLAEGANFYLNESFHYINECMKAELALFLFAKDLESITPTDNDKKIVENLHLPDNPIECLRSDICDVLTDETIEAMSNSWIKSQYLSKTQNHNFELKHTINSIEILGHLNNFGFFIEILVNRHLLFLKQIDLIDDLSYARISMAKIMERLIFIFKEDLSNNKVNLNEIVNLFSLRNKTVHYTPDNAMALSPKISEIIQIWTQTKKIIEKFEKVEKFKDSKFSILLDEKIDEFKNQWT